MFVPSPLNGPDIFIAYSQQDRPLVQQAVRAFEAAGLTVWWDEKLKDILWGPEIEEKLHSCRRIVAFLTERAVNARRDYSFSEVKYAREYEKLIVLRIGQFRMPYVFDGMTALVQHYFFSDNAQQLISSSEFRRVCQACGAAAVAGVVEAQTPASAAERVVQWFDRDITIDDVCFGLALALLEHAPLIQIQQAANELTKRLDVSGANSATGEGASAPAQKCTWLKPQSSRFQTVEAVKYEETNQRFNIMHECCRFQDAERSAAFVEYVWRELALLRTPMVEWLNHLTSTVSAEGRIRIGLALGRLAQADFMSVHEQLLRRWALDEHGARRETADIAFSVASFEPAVAKAIRRVVEEWAGNTSSLPYLRAAVELACGYTGMRMPGIPIATLKKVSKATIEDFRLIATMRAAIDALLANAAQMDDTSLLDLAKLVEDISEWVGNDGTGDGPATTAAPDTPAGSVLPPALSEKIDAPHVRQPRAESNRLPMLLFLSVLSELPLNAPEGVAGVLSLTGLMSNERTRTACARALAAALRDAGDGELAPRDEAREIVRNWAERQTKEQHKNDPVLQLAGELIGQSPIQRDRDRIKYLLRRYYKEVDLTAKRR